MSLTPHLHHLHIHQGTIDLEVCTDIALDPEGNLYFSNAWPGRVYKIDNTGTITPVAGADTYEVK